MKETRRVSITCFLYIGLMNIWWSDACLSEKKLQRCVALEERLREIPLRTPLRDLLHKTGIRKVMRRMQQDGMTTTHVACISLPFLMIVCGLAYVPAPLLERFEEEGNESQ
jgi:hypothetical protein